MWSGSQVAHHRDEERTNVAVLSRPVIYGHTVDFLFSLYLPQMSTMLLNLSALPYCSLPHLHKCPLTRILPSKSTTKLPSRPVPPLYTAPYLNLHRVCSYWMNTFSLLAQSHFMLAKWVLLLCLPSKWALHCMHSPCFLMKTTLSNPVKLCVQQAISW